MKGFFSNFGWLIASAVGGAIGLGIYFSNIFSSTGGIAEYIRLVLGGLM